MSDTWEVRQRPPRPVIPLKPPFNVSPFIRFCRWSALLLGITYGATRHSYLQNRADRLKSLRDERVAARKKREAEELVITLREEREELSRQFGTPV